MNPIMLAATILLAAAVIAVGLMFGARYEISSPMQGGNVWRVDRLTGSLAVCGGFDNKLTCKPAEE
jgi:hypothetical protein